ncbi:hypothetical protein [Brevundimonas sp.]|uniref:hypothetical protein n=1 Tax=Brevundimonas sp. TaxID=1871086 RepID=UPI001A272F8D|nr:hypothetical protein [Brevundimonas sp.]MBJ7485448.1 hypothetical protein [Brevundimonas sp.]
MSHFRLIAVACLLVAACDEPAPEPASVPEVAPPVVTTPEPAPTPAVLTDLAETDPARAPIVAALDAAVARSLGVPARVNVEIARAEGDWAYVSGPAVAADGAELDLSKTNMARAAEEGMMDGTTVVALLKRTAGVWAIAEMAVGPTDVPAVAWPRQYGVSPALVGMEEAEGGDL